MPIEDKKENSALQADVLNVDIVRIKEYVYDKCRFKFTDLLIEDESREYGACSYKLNSWLIIARSAKITPKKVGQFVTFWKRDGNGPIQPFDSRDKLDFFVINTRSGDKFGQFVIPKSALVKRGILTHRSKEGKRGFRVYPPWDKTVSKQAQKTQAWQLEYFLSIDGAGSADLKRAKELYGVGMSPPVTK